MSTRSMRAPTTGPAKAPARAQQTSSSNSTSQDDAADTSSRDQAPEADDTEAPAADASVDNTGSGGSGRPEHQPDDPVLGPRAHLDDADGLAVARHEHDPVVFAAERKLPMLIEKPLATDLGESESTLAAIEKSGVDAVMGYTQRFRRRWLVAKEKVKAGALGEVTMVTSRAFMNRLVAIDKPAVLKDRVGGDVVNVTAKSPAAFCDQVKSKFNVAATVMDRCVHIERPRGHEFIPALVEAFPGAIESVSWISPPAPRVIRSRLSNTAGSST